MRARRDFPLAALLAAAASALCLAVPAGAALRFGPPQTLTPAGTIAFRPHVAYDSQNRATLAWMILPKDSSGCGGGGCRRIQAVRLSPNGTPGTVHTLSPANEDAIESDAQVAVDSQGRATVVWEADDGAHYRVEAVRLGVDGTPGVVQTLSAAGGDAVFPKLAIDSQDRATVVWYRNDGSGFRVQAVRVAADGSPGPVQTLSEAGGDAADPALAIDSQDRVTIVWTRYDGTQYRAQQIRLESNGNPGAVHTLSAAGGNVSLPQVAVGSQGQARAIWEWDSFALGGGDAFLQTALLDANELEGPIQVIDGAITGDTGARLAFDSRNRPRVVWQGFLSGSLRAKTRPIAADGFLGADLFLSSPGHRGGQPQIAFDSKDRAVIAFYSDDGSNNRIRLARLAPDGAGGAVQILSAGGRNAGYPQLALDSLDGATVAWDRRDNSDTLRVQFARGTDGGSRHQDHPRAAQPLDPGETLGEVLLRERPGRICGSFSVFPRRSRVRRLQVSSPPQAPSRRAALSPGSRGGRGWDRRESGGPALRRNRNLHRECEAGWTPRRCSGALPKRRLAPLLH